MLKHADFHREFDAQFTIEWSQHQSRQWKTGGHKIGPFFTAGHYDSAAKRHVELGIFTDELMAGFAHSMATADPQYRSTPMAAQEQIRKWVDETQVRYCLNDVITKIEETAAEERTQVRSAQSPATCAGLLASHLEVSRVYACRVRRRFRPASRDCLSTARRSYGITMPAA